LIKNTKTVDPSNSSSPKVIQIETAMGAAIEVFDGATAIEVDRSRFLPVKTTNDLLLLRSDFYRVDDEWRLAASRDDAPAISLDSRYYKLIGDFNHRFELGAPSLVDAISLTVAGDWTFGRRVKAVGVATLEDEGAPAAVADGTLIGH